MSRFLAGEHRALVPYVPGEQINRKVIKLNTNENPYPPSPGVRKVIEEGDRIERLRLYSDPQVKALHSAIAEQFGLDEKNVFTGNGSDDVLAFSIMAFCGKDKGLCCPDISYGFYPVYADLFGTELEEIPLKDDFSIDADDYCNKDKTIVIANPNAPTGLTISDEDIEKILRTNPDNIVIIDEAYMAFCGNGCSHLLEKYDNLIVVRTFSKSHSLAGLRVGFGLSSEEIIEDLNKLKFSFNPYNMNSLSIAAASKAIADNEYYAGTVADVVETREWAKKEFEKLGFTQTDSKTNFLFVSHPVKDAEYLYKALKERGILVRHFGKERIDNYLRVTVGTREQMETLFDTIKDIIGE